MIFVLLFITTNHLISLMSLKNLPFLLVLAVGQLLMAQKNKNNGTVPIKNGISKPSILSTNPFGIFISRLNHNFKQRASSSYELSFSLESGNIWGPNTKTYIPKDESIKSRLRGTPWFSRQFYYDEEELDAHSYEIETDGVIKGLRGEFSLPLNEKQELVFGFRTFVLTKGRFPIAAVTNDNFIEFFHDNIAGGKDPFDRSIFDYDKARIKYEDRNGNLLDMNGGDIAFGGVETHYYYYPEFLNNKKIYLNFGAHLGTNLSKYNSSLDLGLSFAAIKKMDFNTRNFAFLGFGINGFRKRILNLKSTIIDFGTNDFIGSLETNMEYNLISEGFTMHSFSLSFYMQTSLNKKEEGAYAIHVRNEDAYNSWQHGSRHLYKNNNYWTLTYTFTRKIQTSFYLQQDFTVNNNPDLQTGVGIKFNI